MSRVPLDYHDYSKGTMVLGLRRLKSTSPMHERKGTVLLNAGALFFSIFLSTRLILSSQEALVETRLVGHSME